MPKEFILDEHKWQKAKEIVTKQYGLTKADGKQFYRLVMGVYKQARGTIRKKSRGVYYHYRHNHRDIKRTLKGGRTVAPKARKALEIGYFELIDLEKGIGKDLEEKYPGRRWVTLKNGRHIYIKADGTVADETPLIPYNLKKEGGTENDKGTSNSENGIYNGEKQGRFEERESGDETTATRISDEYVDRRLGSSGHFVGSRSVHIGNKDGSDGREGIQRNGRLGRSIPIDPNLEMKLPDGTIATADDFEEAFEFKGSKYYKVKNAKVFHTSIVEAKKNNRKGLFVDAYSLEDYANSDYVKHMLILEGGIAGVAVKANGDIVSVFKNDVLAKGMKGLGRDLIAAALAYGGNKLDCYDHPVSHFLPNLYMTMGFVPVSRVEFNDEYADPNWNYEEDGRPDVIAFMHNGEPLEDILERLEVIDREGIKIYPYSDLVLKNKIPPLFNDYDEALAHRDAQLEAALTTSLKSLLMDLIKGIGEEMMRKYPGGKWVTMRGRHVYIKKDGTVAPETDPRTTKTRDVTSKAANLTENDKKTLKVGKVYKYRNSTVIVEKIGKKYVTVRTTRDELVKIPLEKFKSKVNVDKPVDTVDNGGKVDERKKSSQAQQAASKTKKNVKTEGKGDKMADTVSTVAAEKGKGNGSKVKESKSNLVFKETEELYGEGSTDKIEAVYNEWKKYRTTYFDDSFPRAWWGVEVSQSAGDENANNYKALVLNGKDGKPVGISMLYLDHDDKAVYIHYVETSPLHRAGSKNKKREKGVGIRLIGEAIQKSIDAGFGGRLTLTSLSRKETQEFYQALGFKKVEGLHYELDAAAAQKLLKEIKARYGDNLNKSMTYEERLRMKQSFNFDRLEALEDKLDGLIVGDIKGLIKAKVEKWKKRQKPLPSVGE